MVDWLIDNEIGDECLCVGLGSMWWVGDKIGSNGKDIINDIVMLWLMVGGILWVFISYL